MPSGLLLDIVQISCEQELALEFTKGSAGYPQEIGKFPVTLPTTSFRDVRNNRYGGPPHLSRQTVSLDQRKGCCEPMNLYSEKVGALPNGELPKVAHPST